MRGIEQPWDLPCLLLCNKHPESTFCLSLKTHQMVLVAASSEEVILEKPDSSRKNIVLSVVP